MSEHPIFPVNWLKFNHVQIINYLEHREYVDYENKRGKHQIIKAKIPLAEMYKYSTTLRSITQGRATFKTKFSSFELVPAAIQEELISQ